MQNLVQDLRFGFRQLRKAPGFTLIAVVTLALGIGATSALFNVIHSTLRLPYPEASRLIALKNKYPTGSYLSVSFPDFQIWRQQTTSLSQLVTFFPTHKTYRHQGEPLRLDVTDVSDGFFPMFGIRPLLGRDFMTADQKKGATPVCILNETFWKSEFGGSVNVLGQTLVLDGTPYEVVGVVPRMVPSLLREPNLWIPLEANPPWTQHGTNYLVAVGRMKQGLSVQTAVNDLTTIQTQIDQQFPSNKHGIEAELLSETLFGDLRTVLSSMFIAVGFILLIACVNIGSMLLARATDRAQEFAIRYALGATAWRLFHQSLAESLSLALGGGLLGWVLSLALIRIPVAAWPKFLPDPSQIHSDWLLLVFITGLVFLTTIFFGSIPVLQILRQNAEGRKLDARVNTETRDRRFARSALLITEIALATLLVSAAANMALYFSKLLRADPGMNPDHVLSVTVSLSPLRYSNEDNRRRFLDSLLEKLKGMPAIRGVAAASDAPFAGLAQTGDFEYEGEPNNIAGQLPFAENYFVSPEYFAVMQVPLLAGRPFSSQDKADSPHVTIINRKMASTLWPHQNAVGKRIKLLGEWQQIIGVVQDVHTAGVSQPVEFQTYLPTQQYPLGNLHLLLRTWTAPLDSAAGVKAAVYAVDPQQPVSNISDVMQLASNSIAGQNTATKMSSILGFLALLLASVGVYGVTGYSVNRRSREFGVRMALGAQRYDILRLLMKETSHLLLVGILLGGVLATLLNHWLLSLLPITTGYHILAFTVTSLVLGSLVYLAALIPARRATSVSPIEVLKAD